MSDFIEVKNHGPLILESNYWDSVNYAMNGYYYLSINAGAFRLLVPDNQRRQVSDMRQGLKHVVINMLPLDQWGPTKFVCEWLCEDDSESPWALQMSSGQIDRHPTAEDAGREWLASVWIRKRGKPHKVFERPAYYQTVPKLPWLKSIEIL